jgi:hypothetical protein
MPEACLRWLHAAVQPCRQWEDYRPKLRLASALGNPPLPRPAPPRPAAVWSAETAWWWQRTEDPAVGGTLDRPEVQGWRLTHHLHLR